MMNQMLHNSFMFVKMKTPLKQHTSIFFMLLSYFDILVDIFQCILTIKTILRSFESFLELKVNFYKS